MIKVVVVYENEEIKSISLNGHADFLPHGQDVVCAGVSSCFIGALNAIKEIDKFQVQYSEGDGYIRSQGDVSDHDKVVLEVLLIQLKTIEESYSNFVKVITERR